MCQKIECSTQQSSSMPTTLPMRYGHVMVQLDRIWNRPGGKLVCMSVREVLAGFEVGSPTLTVGITIPWHEVPARQRGK